jgi:DNA-binding NarL/FixJ family response regulator
VCLAKSSIRLLVVDDYEPWRRFLRLTLLAREKFEVIGEIFDGLEAVQKTQELQPDLILLDIGLPNLNGIEVARRIRKVSPESKILFVSEIRDRDVAQEALRTGAGGYVVKSDAASDLLPAVEAILQGKQFVSFSLAGHDPPSANENEPSDNGPSRKQLVTPISIQSAAVAPHHEVGFYSDDRFLLEDLTQFVSAALKRGSGAIVVATESHRNNLLPRLRAQDLDIAVAIEQGRYIQLDAADTLTAVMVNSMPDPARFLKCLGDLIAIATKAAKGQQGRVAVFGECVHLLWAQGNAEAAVQFEKLGNQLAKMYDVDILCGYSLDSVRVDLDSHIFRRICAQHSHVYSR